MLQILIGNKKGGLTVEILVAIAIIALALMSLSGSVFLSLDASRISSQNTQAGVLIQEAAEAVRSFRDNTSWDINGLGKLATSTAYYPKAANYPLEWQLTQGQETVNSFTRKIIFFDVQRDVSSNIIELGGVIDPKTKKSVISVSWTEKNRPHQISISTYFTNWR